MGSLHPGWCGYNSALGLRVNVSIDPLPATIAELSCHARSSRWRQTARRASHPDCMSIQRRKSASEGHESLDHVPYRPPHTLPCYRSWRLLLKSRNSRTGLLARATISCLPPILNRKQRMWAPSGNGSHLVKRSGPLQSDYSCRCPVTSRHSPRSMLIAHMTALFPGLAPSSDSAALSIRAFRLAPSILLRSCTRIA